MASANRLRRLPAVCVLALLGPVALAGESDAQRFREALNGFNKKLFRAGRAVGSAIGPALKGKAADLDRVRKGMKEAVKVLEEVRKGLAALKPPDSASARKLLQAYERFFKDQEKTIQEDLAEIVHSLETKNPPDPQERERLLRRIHDLGKWEETQLKALQQAERAFAKEHKLAKDKGKQ
jgi:hypothetical protein